MLEVPVGLKVLAGQPEMELPFPPTHVFLAALETLQKLWVRYGYTWAVGRGRAYGAGACDTSTICTWDTGAVRIACGLGWAVGVCKA